MKHPVLAALVLALTLSACTSRTVYDTYQHTPMAGWEKNDTLSFGVRPVPASGTYQALLGLRTSQSYPFTALSLIVEQRILPSGRMFCDTLNCNLVGSGEGIKSQGVSHQQHLFAIRRLPLHRGDSIQVRVRHDMKREILPGISDIGIEISKQ